MVPSSALRPASLPSFPLPPLLGSPVSPLPATSNSRSTAPRRPARSVRTVGGKMVNLEDVIPPWTISLVILVTIVLHCVKPKAKKPALSDLGQVKPGEMGEAIRVDRYEMQGISRTPVKAVSLEDLSRNSMSAAPEWATPTTTGPYDYGMHSANRHSRAPGGTPGSLSASRGPGSAAGRLHWSASSLKGDSRMLLSDSKRYSSRMATPTSARSHRTPNSGSASARVEAIMAGMPMPAARPRQPSRDAGGSLSAADDARRGVGVSSMSSPLGDPFPIANDPFPSNMLYQVALEPRGQRAQTEASRRRRELAEKEEVATQRLRSCGLVGSNLQRAEEHCHGLLQNLIRDWAQDWSSCFRALRERGVSSALLCREVVRQAHFRPPGAPKAEFNVSIEDILISAQTRNRERSLFTVRLKPQQVRSHFPWYYAHTGLASQGQAPILEVMLLQIYMDLLDVATYAAGASGDAAHAISRLLQLAEEPSIRHMSCTRLLAQASEHSDDHSDRDPATNASAKEVENDRKRRSSATSTNGLGSSTYGSARKRRRVSAGSLPSDAEIAMGIFCAHCDFVMGRVRRGEARPFAKRFLLDALPETLSGLPGEVAMVRLSANPTVYGVIAKDEIWDVTRGRNNIFHAVILLLYAIRTLKHNNTGGKNWSSFINDILPPSRALKKEAGVVRSVARA